MFKSIAKKCWLSFAALLITLAILTSLTRFATPWLASYHPAITTYLSKRLGLTLTVGKMEAGWHWFDPVLRFSQVKVKTNDNQHVLAVSHLSLGIDVWKSLWQWQLQPGVLVLDGMRFTFALNEKNQWSINGVTLPKQQSSATSSNSVYLWLTRHKLIRIKNTQLIVKIKQHKPLTVKVNNLRLVNDKEGQHLNGYAHLGNSLTSQVKLIANLNGQSFSSLSGQLYLLATHLELPTYLAPWLPKKLLVEQGRVRAENWLSLNNGKLKQWQLSAKLNALNWRLNNHQHHIKKLKWRMITSWQASGWNVHIDNVSLDKKSNYTFHIEKKQQQLSARFSSLPLPWLVFMSSLGPEKISNHWLTRLEKAHPSGQLKDVQLLLKNKKITTLNAKLDNLSWLGSPALPGLQGLNGDLSYTKGQGELLLSAKNAHLTWPKHWAKSQTINHLNAQLNFEKNQQAWTLRLPKFLFDSSIATIKLSDSQLTHSLKINASRLLLNGKIDIKNLEHNFPLLPKSLLKPGLYRWFKQAFVYVPRVQGRFHFNGPIGAVTKDNKNKSILSAVLNINNTQLRFHPDWPVAKDIQARIELDQDKLTAKIKKAEIASLPLNNVDVLISNLWQGKTLLKVEGKVNTHGKKL